MTEHYFLESRRRKLISVGNPLEFRLQNCYSILWPVQQEWPQHDDLTVEPCVQLYLFG